jgi:hypothetical protein
MHGVHRVDYKIENGTHRCEQTKRTEHSWMAPQHPKRQRIRGVFRRPTELGLYVGSLR